MEKIKLVDWKTSSIFIAALLFSPLVHAQEVSPPPSAQSGQQETEKISDEEQARTFFRKGVELYNDHDYEAALVSFRRAYELAPNYKILYNIAVASKDKHDYTSALQAFRDYLSRGSTEVSEERKAAVQAQISELEKRIGELEIKVNLHGARIRVNDESVGISPLQSPILLNIGKHLIEISANGYDTQHQVVTIQGGDHATANFLLKGASHAGTLTEREKKLEKKSGTLFWVGLGTTAALGIATGVFGIMTLIKNGNLGETLNRYPANPQEIQSQRDQVSTLSTVTDILGIATLSAGAATVIYKILQPDLQKTHERNLGQPDKTQIKLGLNHVVLTHHF